MPVLSNLPPGCSPYMGEDEFEHTCSNPTCAHVWNVRMFGEMGGWFYHDEENDPYCPLCGSEALDPADAGD